jgi:hydrogenase nickel incorporation protein HypA/HybF
MHEYSLVQAMFDQVDAIARDHHAVAVRRVAVRIGSQAGVDVPLFRTAYDLFRERTICDGAPLEVEEVPARWTCPDGHGDLLEGRRLTCARCRRPARLAQGDEIVLAGVDLEVP